MRRLMILMCVVCLLSGCNSTGNLPADGGLPEAPVQENTPESADKTLCVPLCGTYVWNPHGEQSEINRDAMDFIYEPLYMTDSGLNPVPVLAEKLEMTENKLRVYIKKGVKFHDGTELTSGDVEYSVNLIIWGASVYKNQVFSSVTAGDGYVDIELSRKIPLPEKLLAFPIVKRGERLDPESPVGTGPFKYEKKEGYDTFNFIPFDGYHGTKTEFIQLQMISAPDEETVKKLFEIGETDMMRADSLSAVASRSNCEYFQEITSNLIYIGFNTEKVPLNVRRAVYYGVDREDIVRTVFSNSAEFTDIPLIPSWSVFSAEDNANPYNPEGAENELATNGGSVVLEVMFENNEKYEQIYNELSESLKSYGIKCSPVKTDYFYERLYFGQYDVCIGKMISDVDLNANAGPGNSFRYENQEMNALAENKETIKQAVEIFRNDVPFIPVCFEKDVVSVCSGKEINFTKYLFTN